MFCRECVYLHSKSRILRERGLYERRRENEGEHDEEVGLTEEEEEQGNTG